MTALIHRPALPPMPVTDCPDWCASDHYDEWVRAVRLHPDATPSSFLADLLHCLPLYGSSAASLDLVQVPGQAPYLSLDVIAAALPPERARTLADVLRDAADRLEALT